MMVVDRIESELKMWNLKNFLLAIGYNSESEKGVSNSEMVIRTSFYLSFLIILLLYVS